MEIMIKMGGKYPTEVRCRGRKTIFGEHLNLNQPMEILAYGLKYNKDGTVFIISYRKRYRQLQENTNFSPRFNHFSTNYKKSRISNDILDVYFIGISSKCLILRFNKKLFHWKETVCSSLNPQR